ncbi:DEAD/DEAH box helicase family protein [Bartonella rattaustraliani]|uniref:restriction endonuclease n=1 Tax=Bartonella rattaustraliani TaxID=481139 RepID=UPI0002E145AC|nr:DEAD/DEAH box helicase family protein [Bartonella rattaustraliani]
MKLHFNTLPYQNVAVASVVDLFQGEEPIVQRYIKRIDDLVGDFVGNQLPVGWDKVAANLHEVQKRNQLPLTDNVAQKQFCVTMETATGKTYVYTKTIYELHERYGLNKFVIVVPSVAIREGVQKSLEITHEHFQKIYGKKSIRWFIYEAKRLADVREFARSHTIEVMIINIDAFRKSENIINQSMDKMDGERPIDLISQLQPVVIIDEPQSVVNTQKAREALSWLNPLFVLRYSATHREEINTLYNLTPVDAYQYGLVKQISVSSIASQDNFNLPYLRLLSVDRAHGFKAKIELDCKDAKGKVKRIRRIVKPGDDLFQVSKERDIYKDWRITDIDCREDHEKIEINGSISLHLGQAIGDIAEKDIRRAQIRKTIEHHLDKELRLLPLGIKVLSLFFLDHVAHYRIYGDGAPQKGEYARMFEEEYVKLIQLDKYKEIQQFLPFVMDAERVHDGYFSKDKKGVLTDTRGDTKGDHNTYALIMKDKEKLLSMQMPLRFIFSHSALREGWDNPNIFQVCTLLDQSSVLSARQRIGRGLRLCVNQEGERIYDKDLNLLHIIATESFAEFAEKLQKEIEQETGIKFGALDASIFCDMDIPLSVAAQLGVAMPAEKKREYAEWQQNTQARNFSAQERTSLYLPTDLDFEATPSLPNFQSPVTTELTVKFGHESAQKLLEALVEQNLIDKKRKLTRIAQEKIRSDSLAEALPAVYQPIAHLIIQEIRKADMRLPLRNSSREVLVKRKERVFETPEFLAIWEGISQKTHYRVQMDKARFIDIAVKKLCSMAPIEKVNIAETTAELDVKKDGVKAELQTTRRIELAHIIEQTPDILDILTHETKLTETTLFEILSRFERGQEILKNPEKFLEQTCSLLQQAKAEMLSDGVRYIQIKGETYSAQELFEAEEILAYLDNVVPSKRSVYEYVEVDNSKIERNFAQDLENDKDVRFFFKLPRGFKIATPFGAYTPDWAVLLHEYGADKLYLVVETKGSLLESQRRVIENAKIRCAKLHFKSLNEVDYKEAVVWRDAKPVAQAVEKNVV